MRAGYCVQAAVTIHPPFIRLGIFFFIITPGLHVANMVLRPSVVATCSGQNTDVVVSPCAYSVAIIMCDLTFDLG